MSIGTGGVVPALGTTGSSAEDGAGVYIPRD